ncbi:MAG: thioredoxin family protein [Bacteroidota bacterium]
MKNTFLFIAALFVGSISFISSTEKYGLQVGETAPDFELKNVDGKMVSLADFKEAKGFVVNFTCNTCPFAKMYESRVVALQDDLKEKDYVVINIMPNDTDMKPGDSFDEMKKRAKDIGYQYYLIDEKQEVFPKYGATKTPHVYVLDKDLTVQYIGAIDDNPQDADAVGVNYVMNAVDAIEKGQSPDPNYTKAIGCGIKVKQ